MRKRCALLLVVGLLVLFGGRLLLLASAAGTVDAAESGQPARLATGEHRVALVLGAGVKPDGTPSAVLADRVRAGERLLRDGKVDLLLMTGANPHPRYNEPSAMRTLAMQDGVPEERIAVDYGGRRTWDSCKRAVGVFGIRSAIVVTNDFHRARTTVLCEAAGIRVVGAVGTSTGRFSIPKRARWYVRELFASWRGAADAWIHHPGVPVKGGRIDPFDPCAVERSLDAGDRERPPGAPASCATSSPRE